MSKCFWLYLLCASLAAKRYSNQDWPEYGGTLAGQRYAAQKQITPETVKFLQRAWTVHTHALDHLSPSLRARQSFEATPVLWDDTLYFDTPFDKVFAVNGRTGKIRWSYDPNVDLTKELYNITSRGVALWHAKAGKQETCGEDRLFVATLDRRLIARDAATGEPCLHFGNSGSVDLSRGVAIAYEPLYSFTSPPTIVGNIVVLGSIVADNKYPFVASGAVRGFSAITGQQLWTWEPLRNNQDHTPLHYGSGNAWSAISADPEHDLLFVPTGSPSVDYFGGMRKGDNRDANSIVALRASTGSRVWSFQLVHHDLWDYDTASQPLLFTFRKKIPAVAITTKTSMVFVFNRLTGKPLYPVEERPVPKSNLLGEEAWPTQPYSTLPSLSRLTYSPADLRFSSQTELKYCRDKLSQLTYEGLFTPPSLKGSLVYPGSLGGANWGSSALDPRTNVLYTRVSTLPFAVKQTPAHEWPLSRYRFVRVFNTAYSKYAPEFLGGSPPPLEKTFRTPDSGGAELDYGQQIGTPYRLSRTGILSPGGLPCAPEPFGALVAINLNSGAKLWSVPHGVMAKGAEGSIGVGGPVVTAGGLLFVASTNDPYLRAYDSGSGKELIRLTLPVPANATPMSYQLDGRQYIVIAAGGHGSVGQGQSDELIAFALPPELSKVKPGR